MSSTEILIYAVGVFSLMMIGIILTVIEFSRLSNEQSQREGDSNEVAGNPAQQSGRADIRIVHRTEDAA